MVLGVHGLLGEGRGAVGVTPAVGACRQSPGQSRVLFQRPQGGPERRLELLRLVHQQRLITVGMTHAAAEADQLVVLDLPESAVAFWTGHGGRNSVLGM